MSAPDPYSAAFEGAIVADRSPRGIIAVAGKDRQTLLHNLLTNDIAALQPGEGCYAAYLTPQGRLITDMRVAVLRERVLVEVEPAVNDDLLERFDRSIFAEEVRLEDLSALTVVRFAGPAASRVLESAVSGLLGDSRARVTELLSLPEYGNVEWPSGGISIVAVRDDSLGLPGFDLILPHDLGDRIGSRAESFGAGRAGEAILEVLRIEAGRPRFLVDMDRETIPLEAGIESRAISMTKGCYPGQEVIVRVLHRGHGRVARRLVGLVLDGDIVPARAGAIVREGQRVGAVTSAVRSPGMGKPIALGYVRREESEPGTAVTIEAGSAWLPAVVVALPFRR
jgi:folate-binding protein YgfZ